MPHDAFRRIDPDVLFHVSNPLGHYLPYLLRKKHFLFICVQKLIGPVWFRDCTQNFIILVNKVLILLFDGIVVLLNLGDQVILIDIFCVLIDEAYNLCQWINYLFLLLITLIFWICFRPSFMPFDHMIMQPLQVFIHIILILSELVVQKAESLIDSVRLLRHIWCHFVMWQVAQMLNYCFRICNEFRH